MVVQALASRLLGLTALRALGPRAPGAPRAPGTPCRRATPSRACSLLCPGRIFTKEDWDTKHSTISGRRQSPIDIQPAEGMFDSGLGPLHTHYHRSGPMLLYNNGYSFLAEYPDECSANVLGGGPLQGRYRLKQFHFHWGASDERGSEHRVNGSAFPAELHLVHWHESCGSFNEALVSKKGLAVLGVFVEVGEMHTRLQELVEALPSITHKGMMHEVGAFDPSELLPPCLDFWTYPGSLTTPPPYETVTWFILKQSMSISDEQLASFRRLYVSAAGERAVRMVDNFRMPQPIMDRSVRSSFPVPIELQDAAPATAAPARS
ncbi:carbonic anhydrase 1-like [Lethenteron reissneri]|uniref:carbonic anhydrase 1-like n=1 Tax=Lethenteron reissneri TaxID=7753 RepID=UPI002AB5EA49|nr:carbonic anhydrase 1-like [Lethenteron reissneri]